MPLGILDITKPRNRALLGWIGGGVAVLAAGLWAVVTYAWPAHHGGDIACAQNASIAANGNATGVTINANGTILQANGPIGCATTPAK